MTLAVRDHLKHAAPVRTRAAPTVLIWRNLGPYHIARASAATRAVGDALGGHVVVIQLCGREETRDWHVAVTETEARCELTVRTLAPARMLGDDSPSLARSMRAALDELRPSCIAVAGYDRPEMREALRWARRHGAVAVLMSETKWDDRSRPWWKRMLSSYWVRRADAGLVSGSAAAEYLIALGMPRERVFRGYGAVDNAYFIENADRSRHLELRPSSDLPRKYFIACSRLIESRKNIKSLLRAYRGYRDGTADPCGLVICGDGEDRATLERFARQQNLGETDVMFVGFQQIDQLVHYYAHALCFVHPAINEAWGLVVNEAMAAGLPVLVSARCGCAYDLVKPGENGFCFDPNNVDDLTALLQHVAEMTEHERSTMGKRSREIVAAFGPSAFARGLVDAIKAASRTSGGGYVSNDRKGSVLS